MNTKKLSILKLAYAFIWIVGIIWTVLSEMEAIPTEYVSDTPEIAYYVSLASIITAIGGTYMALRLLAFQRVKKAINSSSQETKRMNTYLKWAGIRIIIMAIAVWTNLVLYYATSYSNSTQYCLLIALVATLFCCPSTGEYISLSNNSDKK